MQGRVPNVVLKRERQTCECVSCDVTVRGPVHSSSGTSPGCSSQLCPSGGKKTFSVTSAVTPGPCPATQALPGTDPGCGILVCTGVCWGKRLITNSFHVRCVFECGTCCRCLMCSATARGNLSLTHCGAGSRLV